MKTIVTFEIDMFERQKWPDARALLDAYERMENRAKSALHDLFRIGDPSVFARSITDDLAMGLHALVVKNEYEPIEALVYVLRSNVPYVTSIRVEADRDMLRRMDCFAITVDVDTRQKRYDEIAAQRAQEEQGLGQNGTAAQSAEPVETPGRRLNLRGSRT